MFLAQLLFGKSLEKGEKIEFVVHRHPIVIQKKMARELIVNIAIPGVLYLMFPYEILRWILVAWAVIGILKVVHTCVDWYYDAWLITNKGVVLSQWQGFFNKEWSRVEYHTIEEVSYAIKGFWGTILNFGELTISRFGSPKPTTMQNVIQPKKATKIILSVQENFMRDKGRRDIQNLRNILAEMIQTHGG